MPTRKELKDLFPNADSAFLDANVDSASDRARTPAIVERVIGDEPLAKGKKKARDTRTYLVRYESVRKRFIDSENVATKYVTDFLRYCGCLPDDTYEQVQVESSKQRKAGKKEDESFTITVFQLTE